MSHISTQKFITLSRNDGKGSRTKITLSNVLQSESVKRLLNQPNIIVRTIPLKTATPGQNKIFTIKKNGLNQNTSATEKPEVSIHTVKGAVPFDETKHETLLPSKNSGKSEILIRPVYRKRKPCGHYEPCESLVCDVTFQNYADENGVTPILARSVQDSDSSVRVSKHCEDERCDALSIDHDRCRRATVELYRFDQQSRCDICGLLLKTRKFRANHRGCKRKNVYRHNDVDSAEILRKKMRERELQILESARMKKYEYLDPVNGHNKALEILKKNEELIVIPKTQMSHQTPIVTITTIPSASQTPAQNAPQSTNVTSANVVTANVVNANAANNSKTNTAAKQFTVTTNSGGGNVTQTQMPTIKNVYGNVIGSIPIVIGNQTGVLLNTAKQGSTPVSATSSSGNIVQNPLITVTTVPSSAVQGNNIRPLFISNWVGNNQSQMLTTPIQPKPILAPFRVVPIANFKTQPSLLHQVQGMPKFCIMADTTNMQTILQPPPLVRIQPLQVNNSQTIILPNVSRIAPKKAEEEKPTPPPVAKPEEVKVEVEEEEDDDDTLGEGTMLDTIRRRRKKTQNKMLYKKSYIMLEKERKKPKVKNFACPYCCKKLATEWYFKTHLARHKGETPYVCKVCEKEFVNSYEMKKHYANRHSKHEVRCELCTYVASSEKDLKDHMTKENVDKPVKCWACTETAVSCELLDRHQRLGHGGEICRNCGERVSNVRLKKHLILRHGMTKPRAEEEMEKMIGSMFINKSVTIDCPTEDGIKEGEITIKQECNGEELLDDEITIKEEIEEVNEGDFYDYESYNYEEEENPLEIENETVYETGDTGEVEADELVDDEERRLVVDEGDEEDEEMQGMSLVLEDDDDDNDEIMDADIESQFEEVIENGDEEMEVDFAGDEQCLGDDSPLCNACGKMFVSKKKYMEHRAYCANADAFDETSTGSDMVTSMNGDKT